MSTRWKRRLAMGMVIVGLAVPATASSAAAAADDGDLATRLARVCARIEPAEQRVTAIVTRLEGAADLRGSLAWFEAQIARVTAQNRPKIAADLQARHDVLAARLPLLHTRLDRLDRAADFCRSKGIAI
jgi:hypothetical protein